MILACSSKWNKTNKSVYLTYLIKQPIIIIKLNTNYFRTVQRLASLLMKVVIAFLTNIVVTIKWNKVIADYYKWQDNNIKIANIKIVMIINNKNKLY